MNPMNEQMNNDKPVSEILPLEEVTQAIIIAAKRVRKPITEVIIVQQIVEELLNGGFSAEATEKLKNIFGTKFCVAKGLIEPTPVPTKKEKKEKTDKEKVTGEPAAVEKKPRKKPAPKKVAENPLTEPMPTNPTASQPTLDPIGQSEPLAVEEPAVVKEKKPRKKPAPKQVAENPITEPMPTNPTASQPELDPIGQSEPLAVEEPAVIVVKEKKPRKKPAPKPVAENPLTEPMPINPTASQPTLDPIGQSEPLVVEEPAAVKEKKPRKKPVPKQVAENPLTEPMPTNPTTCQPELDPIGQSEEPVIVVVKEKKPKKKVVSKQVVEIVTTEEKEEPSIEYEEELSAVPLVRQTNHLIPDGFSIDWKPELMEEELSDIDLEDDEE